MLRPILTGQIRPANLMFEPEKGGGGGGSNPDMAREPGNGALEAGNFTAETTSSEDEEPPDFGALGEKHGEPPAAPKAPAPAAPAPEPKPPGETTPPAAPAKPAAPTPPNPAAPKTPKGKPGDEEPFPDIEPLRPREDPARSKPEKKDHPTDPNRYEDGTFKPGKEPKADPKPPEPPKAPEPKPGEKPPEPKPGEKPPEPKPGESKALPKDDADIDGMEPKATASEKTKNDFKALKQIAKEARAEARRIMAEAETLRTQAAAKAELPEEVKQKLTQAEEDAKFRAMFELENEPKARAAYTAKLATAEDTFLKKLMEDPRIKLPAEGEEGFKSAAWLKKVGFDSPEGIAQINAWVRAIRDSTGDELLASEVLDMARGRARIVAERQAEVEALRADRDGYLRKRQEAEKNEFNDWGTEADKTLVQLSQGHDWTDYLKEPENATPEQKAFVEAHNKRVKEEIVPAFNGAVLDVFHRKPAETVSHVFNSMRLKYEVEPELARVKTELEQAQARITELEGLANGVRQVAQVSTAEAAPAAPVTVAPTGISGAEETSADASIDDFLRQKGLRK